MASLTKVIHTNPMRLIAACFCAAMLMGGTIPVHAADPSSGMLQIAVRDEEGSLVAHAPIYVYKEQDSQLMMAQDISGMTMFHLPAGVYRISSALAQRANDGMNRYASPEANVVIEEGDLTCVILPLHRIQSSEMELGSRLQQMGIDTALAQYIR